MLPMDEIEGVDLEVGRLNATDHGSATPYRTAALGFPRPMIRVSYEIRAVPVPGGSSTLTVKMRQGNSRAYPVLIDRAVTIDAPFDGSAPLGAAGNEALLADDIVAGWGQLEIAVAGDPADVTVIARAV